MSIVTRKDSKGRKRYYARLYRGYGSYAYGPTRDTRSQAQRDEARMRLETRSPQAMSCETYAERFLAEYERTRKFSSWQTAKTGIGLFLRERDSRGIPYAKRELRSFTRIEAKDWAVRVPASRIPIVGTMFAQAVEDELLERNPFRGLSRRARGRRDDAPPTLEEFDRLLVACAVHGSYGPQMRAILTFAAYSALRPGELCALEWEDVDFERRLVFVRRRVYGGRLDLPKSNREDEIALTRPARDALLGLPRTGPLVFHNKTGGRLLPDRLRDYWRLVCASAGLDFDLYLATRHYCARYLLVERGMPRRSVQAQLRHIDDRVLDIYAHEAIGALDPIHRDFDERVVPLKPVEESA